jgi:hypothetical protein
MHLVLPVLQPGKPRLVAATPAVFFFLLAPFAFDAHSELLSRASTAAVLTWLATFKVRTSPLACHQQTFLPAPV